MINQTRFTYPNDNIYYYCIFKMQNIIDVLALFVQALSLIREVLQYTIRDIKDI